MTKSRMLQEALEIADCVDRVLNSELPALPKAVRHLYTVGRGSSDHAALVIQQLMAHSGIPAVSMQPSYLNLPLDMNDSLVLIISQSGASPDLIKAAEQCNRMNCPTMSLVNHEDSALESKTSYSLQQYAGPELAVAATKSVICSIVMGAKLAEFWGAPRIALSRLPEQVNAIQSQSTEALKTLFMGDGPILIVGRYAGYGVACEIALKIQELLGRPAMAYSSSEVLHGPAGMLGRGYPVLALTLGPERDDVLSCVGRLSAYGAECTCVDISVREDILASTLFLSQCYIALEAACRESGRSPDHPANLAKVTMTH